jgi:hypothetical protein
MLVSNGQNPQGRTSNDVGNVVGKDPKIQFSVITQSKAARF